MSLTMVLIQQKRYCINSASLVFEGRTHVEETHDNNDPQLKEARGEFKLRLKDIGLQLCTCTWIEIMTGVGVALYLVLGMHNYLLAALAAGLFAPLIVFHFVISLLSRKESVISIERVRKQMKD